jgi:predicted nucleic acid-binding protein
VIYLDSSALAKLFFSEPESLALGAWLADRPIDTLVTSELGRVEILRAARRAGDRFLNEAHAVLADVELLALDRPVQDLACHIGGPPLRALDALHLASAVLLGEDLTTFVAYDHRLTEAARAAGLTVASPGVAV